MTVVPDQTSAPAPADRFGAFGGRYVPETLIPALDELEASFHAARRDPAFQAELDELLRDYVGRPSPLSEAPRLSARIGARVVRLNPHHSRGSSIRERTDREHRPDVSAHDEPA